MKRIWLVSLTLILLALVALAAAPAARRKSVAHKKSATQTAAHGAPTSVPDKQKPNIDLQPPSPVAIDPSLVQPLPSTQPAAAEPYAQIKRQISDLEIELRGAVARGADVQDLRSRLDRLNAQLPASPQGAASHPSKASTAKVRRSATPLGTLPNGVTASTQAVQNPERLAPLSPADKRLRDDISSLEQRLSDAMKRGGDVSGLKQSLSGLYAQLPEQAEPSAPAGNAQSAVLPAPLTDVSTSVISAHSAIPVEQPAPALPRVSDGFPGPSQPDIAPLDLQEYTPDPRQAAINDLLHQRKNAELSGQDVTEIDRQLAELQSRGRNGSLDDNGGAYFGSTRHLRITDNSAAGIKDSVHVLYAPGNVVNVEVTIDTIEHTRDSDLLITLIDPTGTSCTLSNRRGGTGQNYYETVFSDAATTLIRNGTAPFTGSFKPDTALSRFNGHAANGWWKLKVADLAAGSTGGLRGWTLQLTTTLPGDLCSNAIVINSIPNITIGNTCFYNANYENACPYASPLAKDVVYSYHPTSNQQVTFGLCRSYYDTKLYIYANTCSGTPIACSDDATICYGSAETYRSLLPCVSLVSGNTYYIVVDGFLSSCGEYVLEAAACPACDVTQQPGDVTECTETQDSTHLVLDCNGGCANSTYGGTNTYSTIQNNETIFGSSFTYLSNAQVYRDADWYQFSTTESDSIRLTVTAEFPFEIYLTDSSCVSPPLAHYLGSSCTASSFISPVLPAGIYAVVFQPQSSSGIPIPLNYRLTLNQFPTQVGGRCENPYLVSGEFGVTSRSTCGYVNNYHGTCAGEYDDGEDAIYRWTVTEEGDYSLALNPYQSTQTAIIVDNVCPPHASNCYVWTTFDGAVPYSIPCRHFTPGIYYIMVDSRPPTTCIPQYDLFAYRCHSCSANDVFDSPECTEVADTTNFYTDCDGGCNDADLVQRYGSINCGETIHGQTFTYVVGGSIMRDTDWYRFSVPTSDTIRLKLWGEAPLQLSVLTVASNCDIHALYATFVSPCDTGRITAVLPPGDYVVFVSDSMGHMNPVPVNYHLNMTCSPSTPGNTCKAAYNIVDEQVINGQTTCGRHDDYRGTCADPYDTGEDMIIAWTVTQEGDYTIWLDPLGTTYTGLVLSLNCPPGPENCIASSLQFEPTPHGLFEVHLAPGTYFIMMDTWADPACIPAFNLTTIRSCLSKHGGYVPECAEVVDESHIYDDCNGACNNMGMLTFQTIQLGDTVEGVGFTYHALGYEARDTDWYRFALPQSDTVEGFAIADFPVEILVTDIMCPLPHILTMASAPSCTDTARWTTYLEAGDYYFCVEPQTMTGMEVPRIYHAGVTEKMKPGETCQNPIELSDDVELWNQTTCGMRDDFNGTCLGNWSSGEDIVYRWTVDEESDYNLWMYPDAAWTGILLDTQCPPDPVHCLAQATSAGTTPYGISCLHLIPGIYYIVVDSWGALECPSNFGLVISHPGAPANDSLAHSQAVNVPSTTYGRTLCATVEAPTECQDQPAGPGVWYTLQGTGNSITASFCYTDYPWDAQLTLYTCAGTDLTCGGQSDDYCGTLPSLTWCSQSGETYWLLVSGEYEAIGEFRLEVSDDAQPCGTPVMCPCWDETLTAPGVLTGSTEGAENGCDLRPSPDVAVEVLIPSAGRWTFSTCGSTYDTYIYIGTQCCSRNISERDDSPCEGGFSYQSVLCLDLPVAGVYFVTIEGYHDWSFGDYTLSVQPGGYPPAQVTGVTVSTSYCDSVVITWTDVPTAEDYAIYRDNEEYLEVSQGVQRFVDWNSDETHSYFIQSANGCGAGPNSDTLQGTSHAAPALVTGVTATDTRCDSIVVTWNDSPDETGYQVYRNAVALGSLLPANRVRFADGTAAPGTAYSYSVTAYNNYCQTAPSDPDSGRRQFQPGQVANLVASDTLCDNVHVTWSDVDHETAYAVFRNGFAVAELLPVNTVFFDDNTAVPGVRYTYAVYAQGAYCDGLFSLPDSGGVPLSPAKVTGVASSENRCADVLVTWNDLTNETGYRILRNGFPLGSLLPANTVSYHDTSAVPGTPCAYRVQGVMSYCNGQWSEPDSGSRQFLPAQVTNVSASDTICNHVHIAWTDVDHEQGYVLYRNGAGLGATLSANTIFYDDYTATSGMRYSYAVRATGAFCDGALSPVDSGGVPNIPAQVTGVTASENRCSDVLITWNAVPIGTECWIQRNGEAISPLIPATATSYHDTTGIPNVTYAYLVHATRSFCSAPASAPDSGKAIGHLPAVTAIAASDTSCSRVLVTWANNSAADSFQIRRNGIRLGETVANVTSFNDLSAVPGVSYVYRVVAYNVCGAGDTSGNDTGIRLSIPPQVTEVHFTDACTGTQLCWADVANESGYRIYLNSALIASIAANETCVALTPTTPGGPYCYTVQAFNQCGDGLVSSPACITLPTTPPPPVIAGTDSCHAAVCWSTVTGALGYLIFNGDVLLDSVAQNATCSANDLPASGTYVLTVRSVNQCGRSAASNSVTFVLPHLPAIAHCSASDSLCTGVNLSWELVPTIIADSVVIRRNGIRLDVVSGTASTYSDLSATPFVTSLYTMMPYNHCGVGTWGSDSGRVLSNPTQVTGVTATQNRCDSVVVRWLDVAQDTGYVILRDGVDHDFIPANITYYAEVTTEGQSFAYSIRAANRCGLGPVSSSANGLRMTAPLPPTVVHASDDSCQQVVVTWSGQSGDVDSVRIYRDGVVIASILPVPGTWTDHAVTGRHAYGVGAVSTECGVIAPTVQDSGTGHSPAMTPTNLAVLTPYVCDSIRLVWTSGGGEVDGYRIYRDDLPIGTSTDTHYADRSVPDDLPHQYRLQAYNLSCGGSALTATVSGNILPLTQPRTDLPDTLECGLTYSAVFSHCSDVSADSFFVSLNNGPFTFVVAYAPARDSITYSISDTLLHQDYTSHCTVLIISRRGTRVDSVQSTPMVIHCPQSGVVGISNGVPTDFFLDQNYPNPFNPETNIRFGVPVTAEVTLEIYDLLGRRVETLSAGRMSPGIHTVVWNCSECPTGMYLLRMRTGDRVLLKKMLLMK